jgi:uncharacterized protein (TIGR02594 family)
MVAIPRYGVQVQTSPLANKRASAFMTPTAAGSGFGEALQRLGTGVANVAEAMDYQEQLVARADADTAYGAYLDHRRRVLYDPSTGYLNQTGSNALEGARMAALDDLAQARGGIEGGLSPRARAAFARRADDVDIQIKDAAIRHNSSQRRSHVNGGVNTSIAASVEAANLAYNDPEAAQQHMDAAQASLAEKAALNGWTPAKLRAERAELTSDSLAYRAGRIAFEDPAVAAQFLEINRLDMDPVEHRRLTDALAPAVLQQQANDIVGPMFAPAGAPDTPAAADTSGSSGGSSGPASPPSTAGAASAEPGTSVALAQTNALVGVASGVLGMDENAQNAALTQYMRDGGVALDPAVTAWAAAFVNATLGQAGMTGTSSTMARSFLDWGVDSSGDPQVGDIVVLERGAPPFGRVGFFQGYEDDGSVRIMGGDIDDTVASATFAAAKVLGIRRGSDYPAAPIDDATPAAGVAEETSGARATGSQLATGLDQIMAIADPEVRKAALDEFVTRLRVRDEAIDMRRTEAMETIHARMIDENLNPDDLPLDTKVQVGTGGMSVLREAYRNHVNGTDVTDDETYQYFLDLSLSNETARQQRFVDTNLNNYAGELSAGALREMKIAQATLRDEMADAAAGRTAERIYKRSDYADAANSATDQFQAALGTRPGASAGTATMQSWRNFNTQLTGAMRTYADTNGVAMPQQLLEQTIGGLLFSTSINPAGLAGARAGIYADSFYREAGADVDVTLTEQDVPFNEKARIGAALAQRWDRQPTTEEVVDQYEREALHRIGVRPDMDFDDIPTDVRRRLARENPNASREQQLDKYLTMMGEQAQEN